MSDHKLAIASVHGRFQPPHLEHLQYILAALERTDYLYVGVTQFSLGKLKHVEGAGEHRADPTGNPLSYFERHKLLKLALADAGVGRDQYEILPFPIEKPSELPDFLPIEIPILTTHVDTWSDSKIRLLQEMGYQVDVMFDRDPKGIAGSTIRSLIVEGNDDWIPMVPPATVVYLQSLDLRARMNGAVCHD